MKLSVMKYNKNIRAFTHRPLCYLIVILTSVCFEAFMNIHRNSISFCPSGSFTKLNEQNLHFWKGLIEYHFLLHECGQLCDILLLLVFLDSKFPQNIPGHIVSDTWNQNCIKLISLLTIAENVTLPPYFCLPFLLRKNGENGVM